MVKSMRNYSYTNLCSDFETTVTGQSDQTETAVWSACSIDLDKPNEAKYAKIQGSIEDYFDYLEKRAKRENLRIYFHNLKFDGTFIMDFLLRHPIYKAARDENGVLKQDLQRYGGNYEYIYNISDKGQWYTIEIKVHGHYIEFRDSLKLLPFTLEQMGKAFNTPHRKLKMNYTGDRYPNCLISKEEKEYIINDVLVLKECLNAMFAMGHDKLTIGACAKSEFKKTMDKTDFVQFLPTTLNTITTDKDGNKLADYYDADNADEYIRRAYHGGWCYVNPDIVGKQFKAGVDGFTVGTTCDVNSLYPSCLHSDSGNYYPVGLPMFWRGRIPKKVKSGRFYYFIRFKCHFYLKKGYLPTVQIKDNPLYYSREWLKSSDIIDSHGRPCLNLVTMTMTCTDYELFLEHYDVENMQILDGCYFYKEIGLFDDYINHFAKIKIESKDAVHKTVAKLLLNNIYGKLSQSAENKVKECYIDQKADAIRFKNLTLPDKEVWYIPAGAACTAYARAFTIRASQANYKYFCYSDTDSMHLCCSADMVKGAPKDPVKFNHWKYESTWDFAVFSRAKTYIEHVIAENEKLVDKPYYNLKCAGMPDYCKDLFIASVTQDKELIKELKKNPNFTKEDAEYIKAKHTFNDFKVGLKVCGALKACRIHGGTLLKRGDYEMHERPNI